MAEPYVCPNGHPVSPTLAMDCPQCPARVAYEPVAHGMELQRALQRAHDALDREHAHTPDTWADRKRWSDGLVRDIFDDDSLLNRLLSAFEGDGSIPRTNVRFVIAHVMGGGKVDISGA